MRDTTLIVVSRTAAIVGALLGVVGSAVMVVEAGVELWWAENGSFVLLFVVFFAVFASVAMTRQPRNRVVWIMAASSFFGGLWLLGLPAAVLAGGDPQIVVDPALVPTELPVLSAWITAFANPAVVLALFLHVTFGLLLFPDGRLLSPSWRWLGSTTAFALIGTAAGWGYGLRPSSAVPADSTTVFGMFFTLLQISTLGCLLALGVRYRHSTGLVRRQIKWVFWGAAIFVPAVIISGVLDGTQYEGWIPIPLTLAEAAYLAAYGLAVTRYQLFDVDLVISKTAVLAGLAGFITVVYAVVVGGVGVFLGSGVDTALPLSVAATVIVAIAFQPLRSRLTQMANRMVYGDRESPYEVLSKLSARMRDQEATEHVMPRMAQLVAIATGAERVTVWAVEHHGLTATASWPPDEAESTIPSLDLLTDVDHQVPIVHDGATLGAITVSMPRGERLAEGARRLIDDVASQAGLVMRNTLLIEQLRSSRRRLVSAQDDERRRLERDLHDGAQQDFVAAKMRVAMAHRLTERGDVDRATSLLEDALSGIDEGVVSLRRLAHGIYPPQLESEGLGVALQAQTRRSEIPLDVVAIGVGRYSSEIETAVYFCILEAIQNANKYSSASEIDVIVRGDRESLTFEVIDNGIGFDTKVEAMGRGLTNMSDRLDALGGHLDLVSTLGEGTTVFGRLPLGPSQT